MLAVAPSCGDPVLGMRAVVYQHEPHEGVGWLGPALVAAGFALTERFRVADPGDSEADLLVVLGGAMGANDGALHPFVDAEVDVLRQRLLAGRPSLGVCLGAQMLAKAAGSRVYAGASGLEVGALPIRWTPAGLLDPVVGGGARELVVAHWHQDTFDPVPGAVLLASSDRYPWQAYRLGASYAFQFHLELSTDDFRGWLRGGAAELGRRGVDASALATALPLLRATDAARRAVIERLAAAMAQSAAAYGQGRERALPHASADDIKPFGRVAIEFAQALVDGDFERAHRLLTPARRAELSPAVLQQEMAAMWGPWTDGPPRRVGFDAEFAGEQWPAKQPGDVGWAYVGIFGDSAVEAVTVTVAATDDGLRIREVVWGRP